MNADEIRKMEAGRELDVLVAERMMRYKWDTSNSLQHLLFGPDGTIGAVIFYDGIANDSGIVQPVNCHYYSTDIAAAWPLMEKLYTDGWIVSIGSLAEKPKGWRVELCHMHMDDFEKTPTDIEVNADTAPLAICRAALLAITEAAE